MTTFRNPLADPLGTHRGPPLVRGPQFENRCSTPLAFLAGKGTKGKKTVRVKWEWYFVMAELVTD